jgi:hypothetical protein
MAIIAALVAAIYCYLGLHNPYVGFQADDALYLLMADVYSPYFEATLPVYDHVRRYSQLPTLFPLLLGLLGAGTDNLPAARLGVAGFMVLAHLLFYLWLRSLAVPRKDALPIVALHSLLPITLIHVSDLWSEGLYLCFTFLALLAFRYAQSNRLSVVSSVWAGLVVGCAIATRTVGVAFVPALLLVCYRGTFKGAALACAALAVFLALIANLGMGDAGHSYTDLLISSFSEDTAARVYAQLATAASTAWHGFAYDLLQLSDLSIGQQFLVAALLGLGFVGFVASIRQTPCEAIYVASYCSIVAIWPFPEIMNRFLFPLLPFWFYFAYRAATFVGAKWKPKKVQAPTIFVAAVVAMVAPSVLSTTWQLWRPLPAEEFESFRTTRYWIDATRPRSGVTEFRYLKGLGESVGDISTHVAADDCVYTPLTNMVLVQAKRIAWPPPSEEEIAAGSLGRCPYYYVTPSAAGGNRSMFPYEFVKNDTDVVAVHRHGAGERGQLVGVLLKRKPLASPVD